MVTDVLAEAMVAVGEETFKARRFNLLIDKYRKK